jgi:putative membrane protein
MRIAVFGIAIVPLLYSSLYLLAFWDPYGRMDKLPVAVVNEDNGAMLNGKPVNYGKDIVNKLTDDHSLEWSFTANSPAMNGLTGDKYYMVLRIPADFSKDITSVSTDQPKRAQLDFIPNQGKSYLASQIVGRVQDDVATALDKQFSKGYISTLLSAIGKEANGLSTISTNASKLEKGANQVASGAASVNSGAVDAKSGADELVKALSQITPASSQLATGLSQTAAASEKIQSGVGSAGKAISTIQNGVSQMAGPSSEFASGMNNLSAGTGKLVDSSNQLKDASSQAANAANSISQGLQGAAPGATQLSQGLTNVNSLLSQSGASDPNVIQALQIVKQLLPPAQNLATSLNQLNTGSSQLTSSLNQITGGESGLNSGLLQYQDSLVKMNQATKSFTGNIGKMNDGLSQVESGLSQANNGLGKLASSLNQLTTGATRLHTGLAAIATGSNSLNSGLASLQSGTQALSVGSSKLAANEQVFAGKVGEASELAKVTTTSTTASVMASPIQSITHALNPVSKYGQGFVPYFVPLSLWVGAIMLTFLVRLREGRWRLSPVPGPVVALGKLVLLWILAAFQAIIASVVVVYGLGLSVEHVSWFFGFNIFTSITYASVMFLFIALLGTSKGRFAGIIMLVLQLTSSGGTFPIDLVPSFFQAVHPYVPMSYAVDELRNIIAIHSTSTTWQTVLYTLLYLVSSVCIIAALAARKTRLNELHAHDELVA